MSDGFDAFEATTLAVADLAVGGVLARHVSVGLVLVAVGGLVLCTVAYRTVRRTESAGSNYRRPA